MLVELVLGTFLFLASISLTGATPTLGSTLPSLRHRRDQQRRRTFPPRSLQPVREICEKKIQLWKELILEYCRFQKITDFSVMKPGKQWCFADFLQSQASMRLLGSLMMLLLLICFLWLSDLNAQSIPESSGSRAEALDSLLQDYAYRALVRPKTGTVYDGNVPTNLTGIKISALRLRSGSLYRKGVKYKEFNIPPGVFETPYVKRLVLVYQNLGNRSSTFYNLSGYSYLTPVLGLLAYDGSNLEAKNLQELDIRVTGNPISIRFSNVSPAPSRETAKCVWFDLKGVPTFSNVISDNVCSTDQQGHFSIVTESIAPSPAPTSPVPTPGFQPPSEIPAPKGEENNKGKSNSKVWIIVGSVVGGVALLGLLALLLLWGQKFQQKKKMQQMERAAEVGEALHMTPIGNTKAPAATVTRTQPVLESEYVP
ncbi:hypothetical protein G4B88_018919 [Cannabis sativa]|uniref:Uncharacterized protein n=1 Tax=Cannabis sativa TaxID=3483 RepID=A0A7J6H088_CANSA|nr:hypothetical protein G4B88_018919 [Cannabis sativa]